MRLCWGYLHHPERASSPQGRTWLCSLLGNRSIWTRRIATQSWQRRSKEAVNCEEMRAVRQRRYEGKLSSSQAYPYPSALSPAGASVQLTRELWLQKNICCEVSATP